jgi:hypothetical protein
VWNAINQSPIDFPALDASLKLYTLLELVNNYFAMILNFPVPFDIIIFRQNSKLQYRYDISSSSQHYRITRHTVQKSSQDYLRMRSMGGKV